MIPLFFIYLNAIVLSFLLFLYIHYFFSDNVNLLYLFLIFGLVYGLSSGLNPYMFVNIILLSIVFVVFEISFDFEKNFQRKRVIFAFLRILVSLFVIVPLLLSAFSRTKVLFFVFSLFILNSKSRDKEVLFESQVLRMFGIVVPLLIVSFVEYVQVGFWNYLLYAFLSLLVGALFGLFVERTLKSWHVHYLFVFFGFLLVLFLFVKYLNLNLILSVLTYSMIVFKLYFKKSIKYLISQINFFFYSVILFVAGISLRLVPWHKLLILFLFSILLYGVIFVVNLIIDRFDGLEYRRVFDWYYSFDFLLVVLYLVLSGFLNNEFLIISLFMILISFILSKTETYFFKVVSKNKALITQKSLMK